MEFIKTFFSRDLIGYLIVALAALLTGLSLRRKKISLEVTKEQTHTRVEAHSIDEIDELIELARNEGLSS